MSKKIEQTDIEPIAQRFTVNRARNLFLEAIKQNKSKVLESLANMCKTEFSSNLALIKALESWANGWNINTDWVLQIAYDTLLGFEKFPLNIEDSFEFDVNDIWEKREELFLPSKIIENLEFRQNAKNTKIRFSESSILIERLLKAKIPFQKIERELFWSFVSVGWDILDVSKLVRTPKGFGVWQADIEPRRFYLEEAGSLIEKEIESSIFFDLPKPLKSKIKQAKLEKIQHYCNEVVKTCLELQDENKNFLWKKVERKANLKRNAEWAVRYQILGQSFYFIAKKETDKRQDAEGKALHHTTVLREVKEFLKLIGLDERENQRGRRKGQKR